MKTAACVLLLLNNHLLTLIYLYNISFLVPNSGLIIVNHSHSSHEQLGQSLMCNSCNSIKKETVFRSVQVHRITFST